MKKLLSNIGYWRQPKHYKVAVYKTIWFRTRILSNMNSGIKVNVKINKIYVVLLKTLVISNTGITRIL